MRLLAFAQLARLERQSIEMISLMVESALSIQVEVLFLRVTLLVLLAWLSVQNSAGKLEAWQTNARLTIARLLFSTTWASEVLVSSQLTRNTSLVIKLNSDLTRLQTQLSLKNSRHLWAKDQDFDLLVWYQNFSF
jgi:hypothetical protein